MLLTLIISLLIANWSNGQNSKKNSEMIIEDFKEEEHLDWRIVNDGVMGGLSSSKLELIEDGKALFSGYVSLENNGGFASVRGLLGEKDASGIDKILIRVKGDGKKYDLRIRTNRNFDGISYRVPFKTEKDKWTTHEFFLSDFIPSFRGRKLKNRPLLTASEIRQVGILIADKQVGKFELVIDQIKGVNSSQEKTSTIVD